MAKWLPIERCGVVSGSVMIDNPEWEAPRFFACCCEVERNHESMKLVGAIVWSEMPRRYKIPRISRAAYSEVFERKVWGVYPLRKNSSKLDAYSAWIRLTVQEQDLVIEIMPEVAAGMRRVKEDFIPHLSTWLNGKRFETCRRAAEVVQLPALQVDWRRVMHIYSLNHNWNPAFGPPPGSPGCRVPPEILSSTTY